MSRNNYSTFSGVNTYDEIVLDVLDESRNNYSTFSGVNGGIYLLDIKDNKCLEITTPRLAE